MVIFKHTFRNLLTLKFMIIYFIVFIPLFYAFGSLFQAINSNTHNSNLILDQTLGAYFVITFMWTLGIPFLITTASRGTALIQKEIDDETLVLLVSKPISRLRIYVEKWAASFAISMIIGILSIFLSLSLYMLLFTSESTILEAMLYMIPSLLIYVLLINFVFTSLSMTIASLIKHRTRAIILLVVIIMIYQLIFPMFKSLLLHYGLYDKYHLYYIDINYQFGLMYYTIISLFSPIQFTPVAQRNINTFVNIFSNVGNIQSDYDIGFVPNTFKTFSYMNPYVVFFIWIGISCLLMFLAYRLLEKKDIS